MGIDDKLKALGIKPIFDEYYPLKPRQIARLQKLVGYPLPKDYLAFVTKYGCSDFSDHDVEIRSAERPPAHISSEHYVRFTDFLGGDTKDRRGLLWCTEVLRGRMPATLIPIARDFYNNKFCLGLGGEDTNKVYLWDFENEPAEEDYLERDERVPDRLYYSNLTLIAKSFTDFINQMRFAEEE